MTAKLKKAPKRGRGRQLAEIKQLQRRIAAGGLLDIKGKDELLIDEFKADYGRGLRSDVERIARNVVAKAVHSLKTFPAAREVAASALQTVAKLDQETQRLIGLDARALATGFMAKGDQPPSLLWKENLTHVHDCYQVLLGDLELIATLPGGRIEVLADHFVTEMYVFHVRQTGRRPSKSKTARFVDFMLAAWADLHFPKLPEGALGSRAERLPHSKLIFQKRTRQAQA
ncbi:hypothetical protein V1282_004004 [Nitrobacteraceae bacterium AZCC 2146]